MSAYYNEIDPFAAAWLRNLIAAGHIAPGDVDERSIREVSGDDLRGFRQCHFFAGIGVWSYALRCAGWPDDRPVWTGSCPCQPFSVAGQRRGEADDRHLFPVWHRLIRECRPPIVLGEQVAGKAGYGWWDAVSTALEGDAYACAAADLAAASVGAPHIRQRLLWLAYANGRNPSAQRQQRSGQYGQQPEDGSAGGLADSNSSRLEVEREQPARRKRAAAERGGEAGGLDIAEGERYGAHSVEPVAGRGECAARQAGEPCAGRLGHTDQRHGAQGTTPRGGHIDQGNGPEHASGVVRPGPLNGLWADADWLGCTDGKWRPVEPGTFPLATGLTGRVGLLRGYGNAICAPVAQAFIESVMEVAA